MDIFLAYRHVRNAFRGAISGVVVVQVTGGIVKSFAAVVVTVLLPFSVWSAGLASSDATDDQYLQLLASRGITGQPDQLIAAGRQACDLAGLGNAGGYAGPYLAAVTNLDNTLTAMGFNKAQKQQLAVDAARTYCPQFAPPQ